jgi:DNA end-binding protein Ku
LPEARSARVGRALWSGTISFGLVSVPVELYSAARRNAIALRMLGPDGTPLARQYVCPEDDQVLDADAIERGVEVADGEWVVVTDEELEKVAPRRSRDIALERFVPRDEVDPAYFVRAYFLVPGGEQTKAYRLLAETMESSGRAAIASFVMRGKAHALAILADEGVLRAETLRFGDEVRSAERIGLPEPCEVPARTVTRMAKALDALAADEIDASELEDDQADRLLALARRKQKQGEDVFEVPGEEAAEPADEGGANVVDLMALIKRRMSGTPDARRSPVKRASGAKERPAAKHRANLDDAPMDELYERARKLDIPGRSKMSRKQLLASLRRVS